MSSSNNLKPKFSRVAKISVKPVWRRKLDSCQQINDLASNQPTSKHHSNSSNSSQNNNPNIDVDSPQIINSTTPKIPPSSHYLPHSHENSNNTIILTQQDDLNITLANKIPQPSHSSLPNDPFEENTQSTNHNNQPISTTLSSPSSEQAKFVEELKEAHELNALLALHLAQRNLDPHHTSTNSSPSNNLNHLENHVNNCICCTYLEKQSFVINEHLSWIEYLLTKSLPSSSFHQSNPSAPNSPPPNTPYSSPSNN